MNHLHSHHRSATWSCCRAGLLWLTATLVLATAILGAAENRGELIIRVHDLPSDRGHVRFALYDSADTYERRKDAFRKADLPVRGNTSVWRIQDLPFGEYALMLHHDENDNRKMDRNFLGIPKEGYGFSNDATPGFSAPPYEQSKFRFDRLQMTLDIHLQH